MIGESASGYQVYLIPPGQWSDPLSNEFRLLIARRTPDGRRLVLKRDGTWDSPVEGTQIGDEYGYLFPVDSIEAFGQAIEQYLKGASHSATEVAVLREWLQVERQRVEHVLQTMLGRIEP
jgi:hypothetical protein